MLELLSPFLVLLFSLLSIVMLGLLAGFSPTLYITQITIGAKSKKSSVYSMALIGGVLLAIIVLTFLFQILNLQTLLNFIDSTIHALVISVVFNIFIAVGLIVGGFWYIGYQDTQKPPKTKVKPSQTKTKSKVSATLGFGFIKTFTSISGILATYIASNSIAGITTTFIQQILYTLFFLLASVLPFLVIFILLKKHAANMAEFTNGLVQIMKRFNYRLTIGVTAIIVGCSIFILQILTAFLY